MDVPQSWAQPHGYGGYWPWKEKGYWIASNTIKVKTYPLYLKVDVSKTVLEEHIG